MAASTGASKNWYTELSSIPAYASARFLSDKGKPQMFTPISFLPCISPHSFAYMQPLSNSWGGPHCTMR